MSMKEHRDAEGFLVLDRKVQTLVPAKKKKKHKTFASFTDMLEGHDIEYWMNECKHARKLCMEATDNLEKAVEALDAYEADIARYRAENESLRDTIQTLKDIIAASSTTSEDRAYIERSIANKMREHDELLARVEGREFNSGVGLSISAQGGSTLYEVDGSGKDALDGKPGVDIKFQPKRGFSIRFKGKK